MRFAREKLTLASFWRYPVADPEETAMPDGDVALLKQAREEAYSIPLEALNPA